MLKTFWIDNQKFLLLCGGVLLAFLIATSFLGRLAEGAERTYERCRRMQREIDQLHSKLKKTYWPERRKAEAYEEHEKHIHDKVGLPPEPELENRKTLLIQFNKKIDDVWEGVQAEASRRGMLLPEKLTGADFGIEADHGPPEYRVFYSYLEVVRVALRALVLSGMNRIGPPELIGEVENNVVTENEIVGRCLYRGVGFSVIGSYASFVAVLERVQQEKPFLQARIINLSGRRSRGAEEDLLLGEIEFYGFRVREFPPDDGSGALAGLEEPAPLEHRRRR